MMQTKSVDGRYRNLLPRGQDRQRRVSMLVLTYLLAGLVFGLGLIVSGMANPAKVIGFLDLAGAWDPSLAMLMAGAIAVGVVAFAVARRRMLSFIGAEMKLATPRRIDRRLGMGSMLFGVGWGVAVLPRPGCGGSRNGGRQGLRFRRRDAGQHGLFELLERPERTATSRTA